MTNKFDLGALIAALAAGAVVAAVVAGYLAVGSPGDARAERLDEARLSAMEQIAGAAQCVYAQTGETPATLEQLGRELRLVSTPMCRSGRFGVPDADVTYEVAAADRIRLCTEFARRTGADFSRRPYGVVSFPEFDEVRATAGRHCYAIQLSANELEAGGQIILD